ncbi:MAG: DUF4136 domain-containing protein [Gemmatimonadota bacterium]
MKPIILGVGVAAVSFAACSSKNVSIDVDDSYSFAGKRAYAWLDRAPDRPEGGDDTERRVRRSVDANLADKGFRVVPFDEADFIVSYAASAKDQMVYETYGYGAGRWTEEEDATITERVTTEGSLTISIFDAGAKDLVWRANARETLNPTASPDQRDALVAKAVSEMFRGFPPGS